MATLLVVDDSESNATLLKLALETQGYTVICALNGQEGLRLAKENQPDLLITDLRLPGADYDGWMLIRLFKEDPILQHIPIIVTSVEINYDDRQRAYEAGCNAYFSKPFRVNEIRQYVAKLLSQS